MADDPDPERTLARFALDLSFDDLSPATRDHVGLVVADTVGVAIGGCRLDEPRTLAAAVDDPGEDRASILGTDAVAPPGRAAMVVATAGTSLELDEGHQYAGGHPAIHALPAALAEAEARGAAPADWLAGFVAGYEVGTRVARACAPLDPSYHMHGLWGAVGATAAVARVRGLSLDRTTEALRMAPNHALHTRFETALEGATVRNTYAGASNLAGSLVATQAAAGFSGLDRGIERHLGRVADADAEAEADADADAVGETGLSPARLTAGLGSTWEVERGYFKTHAACRFTHPTLDAVAALAEEAGLDPDAVESVTVETYRTAARLDEPRPTTPLQAKFSLPFAVATRLRRGHSRPEAFAPGALDEPTYELAERVTVRATPRLTERAPDRRGARVTVETVDGRHERTVPQARGGADDPFSEADLADKFETLVAPALGADRAADLWAASRDPAGTPAGRLGALATPP